MKKIQPPHMLLIIGGGTLVGGFALAFANHGFAGSVAILFGLVVACVGAGTLD